MCPEEAVVRVAALVLVAVVAAPEEDPSPSSLRSRLRRPLRTPILARTQFHQALVVMEAMAAPEVRAGNPAEAAEVAEESARAMAALMGLPSEQREVVALHIHGQFTFREISRLLEIPMNTAKSRYRYALSALRKELNHNNR